MRVIYSTVKFGIILCSIITMLSCVQQEFEDTSANHIKVALRDMGNRLLLAQEDSTSLVLPVKEVGENLYELSFENPISFDPDMLNDIVEGVITLRQLPKSYLVEVLQCEDQEVAYSYEMLYDVENNIVPCRGRIVPAECYTIQFKFFPAEAKTENRTLFYILVVLVLLFLAFVFYSRYASHHHHHDAEASTSLGIFTFYPEQNKLIKEAQEISLSNKECELLAILSENMNQIVKREELTKKVWEDNGVIVGRSLDTYISKLRKKLQADDSLKITNVHGVGYKLELSQD